MYATLYDFLRMSPSDQAKVTHLDLSIADPEDFYRASQLSVSPNPPPFDGLGVGSPWRGEAEEWAGEAWFIYPPQR